MRSKTGWWLAAGLILVLLAALAVGLWLWLGSSTALPHAGPLSAVSVELTTPSSGDEVSLGAYVSIAAQSVSPNPIQKSELYVDGQSQGAVSDSPQTAYWSWRALPAGIHTLYVVSSDAAGNVGQSQTVILNVLEGNGTIQVPAEAGQTLEQAAAGLGAPADQLAAANPHLDPAKPLEDGQQVQVPIPAPGGDGGMPSGGGQADGPAYITIKWAIELLQPADQAYCYESNGNGEWDKMPKDPFTFFPGAGALYTQLIPLSEKFEIQVQCWGWLGGALKYLGEGKTSFDTHQPPPNVLISSPGFQLSGISNVPGPVTQVLGGGAPNFPPPYAVREPTDAADCTAHSNPLLAPFICKTLLGASVKQYRIIEWEWKAPPCWIGACDQVVQAVDGYRIYKVDPVSKVESYVKQIDNGSQKITMIALGWAENPCYGVRAFVNSPAMVSGMATYCPGQSPQPQLATFHPTAWVTTGGQWIEDGDCSGFGGLEPYLAANQNKGLGENGEVMVGEYIVDDSGCFRQGDYAAGVKFNLVLPQGGVVQKAVLKYSTVLMDFGSTGWASPKPASCLSGINKSTVDWTAHSAGDHYANSPVLYSPKYGTPITSVSQWSNQQVDVTSAAMDWIAHPSNNRGLNLTGAPADAPKDDGTGKCLSGLGNFQLDVYYFAP